MSCERNGSKFGGTAAVKNGISAIASKAGNAIGATISAVVKLEAKAEDVVNNQVARRVAPTSNAILGAVDRPAVTVAKVAPAVIAAAVSAAATYEFQTLVKGQRGWAVDWQNVNVVKPYLAVGIKISPRRPSIPTPLIGSGQPDLAEAADLTAKKSRRIVGQVATVTSTVAAIGSAMAANSSTAKNKAGGRTLELKKGKDVIAQVLFIKSEKVTKFLNNRALMGSYRLGKGVIFNDGEIVRVSGPKGRAWHRGTTIVDTPEGRRTITHLQRLSLPTHCYYFNRKLSDKEAAGIVTGREKAHHVKGYAGEIHPNESLTPGWGLAKKAMITTKLFHPSQEARWTTAKQG